MALKTNSTTPWNYQKSLRILFSVTDYSIYTFHFVYDYKAVKGNILFLKYSTLLLTALVLDRPSQNVKI